MKALVLSDLHLDLHADKGETFFNQVKTPADVLILAGDITSGELLPETMARFCAQYPHVVYVHGNHEFYGSDRETILKVTRSIELSNFHWLDCDSVEIEGQRFLGAPLWFRKTPFTVKNRNWLTDFIVIRGYSSWVYEENKRAVNYLAANVKPGDIVVTHHLPSPKSVHPMYKGEPSNAFFLCHMEDIITTCKPALWVHGHTHKAADYVLGDTRVVCNPLGYLHEGFRDFDESKVIDL